MSFSSSGVHPSGNISTFSNRAFHILGWIFISLSRTSLLAMPFTSCGISCRPGKFVAYSMYVMKNLLIFT